MKIYWSYRTRNPYISDLSILPPESLYTYLKKKYSSTRALDEYFQCYAAGKDLLNTFIIKSNFDIDLIIDNKNLTNQVKILQHDQAFYDSYIIARPGTVQLNSGLFLFCEKSVTVTQLPAFFHKSPFKDTHFPTIGSMDISSWFRGWFAAFVEQNPNDDYKHIKIKRGDPLFYIKINSDEKIELKEFDWTENLTKYCNSCTSLKFFAKKQKLQNIYSMFRKRLYHKKILKEIKENLIE